MWSSLVTVIGALRDICHVPGPQDRPDVQCRQNAPVSAVKPQYGPTLVQLLAPRPLAVRIAAGIGAALLVVAVVLIALSTRPDVTYVLEHEPVTFNFGYGPQFERVS